MDLDQELLENTPPEIRQAANVAMANILPAKSKDRYELAYNKFLSWAKSNNIKNYSENCLIVYFENFDTKKSLWSTYSMLRSCLILHNNIDISKYAKLIAYLKQQTKNLQPRKSAILNEEQITKFIADAPDSLFLLMKVNTL